MRTPRRPGRSSSDPDPAGALQRLELTCPREPGLLATWRAHWPVCGHRARIGAQGHALVTQARRERQEELLAFLDANRLIRLPVTDCTREDSLTASAFNRRMAEAGLVERRGESLIALRESPAIASTCGTRFCRAVPRASRRRHPDRPPIRTAFLRNFRRTADWSLRGRNPLPRPQPATMRTQRCRPASDPRRRPARMRPASRSSRL